MDYDRLRTDDVEDQTTKSPFNKHDLACNLGSKQRKRLALRLRDSWRITLEACLVIVIVAMTFFRSIPSSHQMSAGDTPLFQNARGFIHVDKAEQGLVGPPLDVDIGGLGHRESYTISYFHQIHCVAKVAALYADARLGVGDTAKNDEHMAHCLDVLRQSIMCLADATLENGLDKWEVIHECRDYRQLVEWETERQVYNWTSILGAGHRIDVP
ncbi:MAG: hypothetical protein MMC33_007902 [Icmadophila ericetorum]|nr:hypothetical protein [Icmadophila ericetorum]